MKSGGFKSEYLLPFLLPLIFYSGFKFVKGLIDYPWQSVPCVIKSGFIEPNPEKTASKLPHRANVIFSCDRPNVGTYMWRDFATEQEAQTFLQHYPPGSNITGYGSGTEQTLIRKPLWHVFLYLIPVGLAGFFIKKISAQISREKKQLIADLNAYDEKKKQLTTVSRNVPVFDQKSATALEDGSQSEEWKEMLGQTETKTGLKPRKAQLMQFFGILLMFVIVTSLATWATITAYKTWKSAQPAGCAIAAAPFLALAGIRLLYALLRQLLGLVNPRPEVQLSSTSIWPGGSMDLSWRYEGKIGGARKLLFILVGREYVLTKEKHKGRTRHTSKHVDSTNVQIHEIKQAFEIRDGRARVKIPERLMHSFHFGFSRIEWTLRVEVKIGGWADLHEEYPIIIEPAPVRT
jgi:hypothetical protein